MFRKKFSPKIGEMYVLYDGDIKKDGDVIYLPYYCASVLQIGIAGTFFTFKTSAKSLL